MASAAPLPHDDTPREDHSVLLHGVSWEDYERLDAIRGDASVPRLTYLEGNLEIMSPSKDHEAIKSLIARLVEAYCLDRGIDLMPYGSWTLKDKPKQAGAEPDECYVFDERPRDRPQLAIEVSGPGDACTSSRSINGSRSRRSGAGGTTPSRCSSSPVMAASGRPEARRCRIWTSPCSPVSSTAVH